MIFSSTSVPMRNLYLGAKVGLMGLGIYVDGKYVASFGSLSGWGAAASYIEKHTAHRTPLRRLAEEGETYQPEQAAVMLANLLNLYKPAPDIAHTLSMLYPLLKGKHVAISDGMT